MLKMPDAETRFLPREREATGLMEGPGRLLTGIFQLLDDAGMPYCVLHGYENYPRSIKSDVDVLIHPSIARRALLRLFRDNRGRIGGDVIRCRGLHFIVAGASADGTPFFLDLDMTTGCGTDGLVYGDAKQLLQNRRRFRQFWIPAAGDEFGCYLARSIAGGRLDVLRARKLSALFREDRFACQIHVERLWKPDSAALILPAAASGDWCLVLRDQERFKTELRQRLLTRHPVQLMRGKARSLGTRLRSLWHTDGVNVVLLGPDGAGKSSVIDALSSQLSPAFSSFYCAGFAPSLNRLLGRPPKPVDQPHALPRRSFPVSIIRGAYWFAYNTLGHPYRHLALSRSTFILNDRHFIDIFVDTVRYRYGGPRWLLRLVWALSPRPDLIILLDAPPEVLQSRKQEVSFEETARQRHDYLMLVKGLKNGRIVNAAQPFQHVVNDASRIILNCMSTRISNQAAR